MPATPIYIDGENNSGDFKRGPLLGEHTMELLQSVGYTEEEIRALADKKVITVGYTC